MKHGNVVDIKWTLHFDLSLWSLCLAITVWRLMFILHICDCILENQPFTHKNWNPSFACTWCTIDTLLMHALSRNTMQVLDDRFPGLLWCCETTRVLSGINRTAWGTELLLTAVLASFVNCISLCHTLKAQHCCLRLNGCFNPPPPPPYCPSPIDSIRDIIGAGKNHLKKQQHLNS